MKTSTKLLNENLFLGQSFKSAAQLLLKLYDCAKDWLFAPIWGHSRVEGAHKFFTFYPTDIGTLQAHKINTVSQIFESVEA
jgi:hypothetical protein